MGHYLAGQLGQVNFLDTVLAGTLFYGAMVRKIGWLCRIGADGLCACRLVGGRHGLSGSLDHLAVEVAPQCIAATQRLPEALSEEEVWRVVWKIVFSTFCLVFVAELGDKTQLATMLLAAKSASPGSVFIGSAAALVMSSVVGVLAGSVVTRLIPPQFIQLGAGVAFVVLGILLIAGKF